VFAGVRNDMTIAREEIFGPVLCIIPYDSGSKSADVSSVFSRTGAFGSNSARFCADSPPVIERSSVL
jgi:acyl-CoA reductase-like NAD-dependent aldehyde dehydrogenase